MLGLKGGWAAGDGRVWILSLGLVEGSALLLGGLVKTPCLDLKTMNVEYLFVICLKYFSKVYPHAHTHTYAHTYAERRAFKYLSSGLKLIYTQYTRTHTHTHMWHTRELGNWAAASSDNNDDYMKDDQKWKGNN